MRTYEYPLGTTFRASTPEHAAARAFGGKPGDYIAVEKSRVRDDGVDTWIEVCSSTTGMFEGDIDAVS